MPKKARIDAPGALHHIIVRGINRRMIFFGLTFKELLTGGKQRKMVQARSVICYWGTREMGMSAVSLAKKLNIASSTASESAMRGRQIVEDRGWKLLEGDETVNPRNVPQIPPYSWG